MKQKAKEKELTVMISIKGGLADSELATHLIEHLKIQLTQLPLKSSSGEAITVRAILLEHNHNAKSFTDSFTLMKTYRLDFT